VERLGPKSLDRNSGLLRGGNRFQAASGQAAPPRISQPAMRASKPQSYAQHHCNG
jgi:hypothetical protein